MSTPTASPRSRPRGPEPWPPSCSSQLLTRELAEQADIVVTMGCGDQCPHIPGKRYIDWELPDPAGQPLATVRAIRDRIATQVNNLLTQLD